jgi:hypothetical protein
MAYSDVSMMRLSGVSGLDKVATESTKSRNRGCMNTAKTLSIEAAATMQEFQQGSESALRRRIDSGELIKAADLANRLGTNVAQLKPLIRVS